MFTQLFCSWLGTSLTMRQVWRRRDLLRTLCPAGVLGLAGCGGEESTKRSPRETQSWTSQEVGTPAQTSANPSLVANRSELSWFVEPSALFEKKHYGVYLYDIPRLRAHSSTLQVQPLVALDVSSDDLSPLGIEQDQIDSLLKIDGITRSIAEIVLFFGSFDPSIRPSTEAGEILSTIEYGGYTLHRVSTSGGDIAIAKDPHTTVLATDTAKKDPMAAAKSMIATSRGDHPRYQAVHAGFADMLDALWDGAITVVGTHESWRNSVQTNPETGWGGSIGVGSSVRLRPETSDIRLTILYPSMEEAETRREDVARRARISDELYSTAAEQRGSVVVLTGKRATSEIMV